MLGSNPEGASNGKRRISENIAEDVSGKRARGDDEDTCNLTTRPNVSTKRLSHEDYTIGWICALPLELTAARAMLDEEHMMLPVPISDQNVYSLGSIFGHNVVIACLPAGVYGLTSATAVGLSMRTTFPNSADTPLMVGIGGGVPSERHDIRLGDVVVSLPSPENPAVKQYDYGKTTENGLLECRGTLNKPAHRLLNAVASLRAQHDLYATQIPLNISMALRQYDLPKHRYPGAAGDVLYEPECEHVLGAAICGICGLPKQIARPLRQSATPVIHYGSIASGNQVIKHAKTRDRLAQQHDILCFEMEAAGLMDHLPCLVIRGISDYCDSHKHKQFQGHAALAAAAYAKELLSTIPVKQSTTLPKIPVRSNTEVSPLMDEKMQKHCRSIMKALDFEEAEVRRDTVKNAHSQTCRWILDRPEYVQWLDPDKFGGHQGLFWLKGKPATGKSTMMKYILNYSEKRRSNNLLVISFFFNARGYELEKSILGMYRSLLFQLLSQARDLESVLCNVRDSIAFDQGDLNLLVRLFKKALQQLGARRLLCFIDALDECPEDQIREMLETFVQFENARFLVCFSSRHYPNISVNAGVQLILENQDGHLQDLTRYIASELQIGTNKRAESLKQAIFDKSNGIFLWVVLVIGILKRENDHGRVHALEKRLNEIPVELNDLFRNIFLRDPHNLPDFILCIQWVLYARRPLRPEQLYFALLSANDQICLEPWDPQDIPISTMHNYILNCSKGLVELTRGVYPTMQFIHESVREYLLKIDDLVKLYPGFQDVSAGTSHQKLRDCCYRSINFPVVEGFVRSIKASQGQFSTHKANCGREMTIMFPFLSYAAEFVLFHAAQAHHFQIEQFDFLRSFRWLYWKDISKTVLEYEPEKLSCFSLCLAKLKAPEIIQIWWSLSLQNPSFHELLRILLPSLNLKGFVSLYIASFCVSKMISDIHMKQVTILFSVLKDMVGYLFGGDPALYIFHLISDWGQVMSNSYVHNALSQAALQKHAEVMQLLLDHYVQDIGLHNFPVEVLQRPPPSSVARPHLPIETIKCISMLVNRVSSLINDNGKWSFTAIVQEFGLAPSLVLLAPWADLAVVKFLLAKQSSPDLRTIGESVRAALKGRNLPVADLFLQKLGADNTLDEYGNAALHIAVESCSSAAVKLILNRKPNGNLPNANGYTAMHWACSLPREEIVDLLAKYGVSVNVRSADGESPLHIASRNLRVEGLWIMQKLIAFGAKVGVRDKKSNVALHKAVNTLNSEERIQLLIASGAEIDPRNEHDETPLHCAAFIRNLTSLSVLLENGAQTSLKDSNGRTAMHRLVMSDVGTLAFSNAPAVPLILDFGFAVGLLVQKGANLEDTDNHGRTPLHIALHRMILGECDGTEGKALFEHGAMLDLAPPTVEKDEEWNLMCSFINEVRSRGSWLSRHEFEAIQSVNEQPLNLLTYELRQPTRPSQTETVLEYGGIHPSCIKGIDSKVFGI